MLQQLNEPKAVNDKEQIKGSNEALVSLSEESLLRMLQQVCTVALNQVENSIT